MLVDQEVCSGCGTCTTICPVGAIRVNGVVSIDRDLCVECGVCERMNVCPEGSFHMEESLPWPRSIRAILSNPLTCFKETGVTGRGTEEMKTNDLTNRYVPGMVGVALDIGRPNVSTSLRDVERVTVAVARAGVQFEGKNPITYLMPDKSTGMLDPEVLNERVMSAVVEFTVPMDQLPQVVKMVQELDSQVDTVFTFGVICRVEEDNSIPAIAVLESAGLTPGTGAKVNLGLGRLLND
jgi:NAD-dependent dihydropyrimidine dehydrogenase PreA subunit